MKKALFFRKKIIFTANNYQLFSGILIFLLTVLIPTSAYAEGIDSAQLKKRSDAVIYVSGNATIYGSEYISSSKLELSPKETVQKSKSPQIVKLKSVTIKEQVASNEKSKKDSFKNVQKEIDKRIKDYLNPISSDSQFINLDHYTVCGSLSFTTYSSAFITDAFDLNILKIHISKQKFDTSLSFLQFRKLLDSFLRGPPPYLFS